MELTTLVQFWHKAATELGFQLLSPFVLSLASGHKLEAEFRIKNFGAASGMLIFRSYGDVSPYSN